MMLSIILNFISLLYMDTACVPENTSLKSTPLMDSPHLIDTATVQIAEIIIHENRLKTSYAAQNKNIRILDKDLLASLPGSSINEALGHVAGVDMRQRGPFGIQADLSVDGGTFEQTLILINGVRMLDAQTAHHALNLPITMDAIERIEVIRGPSARVYGINSLTGAINIITKNASKSGLRFRSTFGSSFRGEHATPLVSENPREDTAHTKWFYGHDSQLSGDYVSKKAGVHSLSINHSKGNGHRYNTAFEQNRIFHQSNWKIVSLMAGYVSSDFGANGFYAAPGDKESREIVQTGFFSISSLIPVNQSIQINPKLSYRGTADDYRYFGDDLSRGRSEHSSHSLSSELHVTWNTGRGDFGWGAEWRKESINSTNIGVHQRNNFGSYAEFRTSMGPKFSMNTGAYLNYHSDYGWQVFPGIDLGYAFHPRFKWTLHFGTGQRVPSFTDLYLDQRPGNVGNPAVRPEEAWHLETGAKYTGNNSFLQVHYFHRSIQNFIDWVYPHGSTPPYVAQNFSLQEVQGVSLGWDWWTSMLEGEKVWRFGWHYTFLNPKTIQNEAVNYVSKYSIESLRQQLTAQVSYKNKGFRILTAARFQERISYKSYVLADARMSYQFGSMRVFLDLKNVLDTRYVEAAAVPMPGRWYNFGVDVKLI